MPEYLKTIQGDVVNIVEVQLIQIMDFKDGSDSIVVDICYYCIDDKSNIYGDACHIVTNDKSVTESYGEKRWAAAIVLAEASVKGK